MNLKKQINKYNIINVGLITLFITFYVLQAMFMKNIVFFANNKFMYLLFIFFPLIILVALLFIHRGIVLDKLLKAKKNYEFEYKYDKNNDIGGLTPYEKTLLPVFILRKAIKKRRVYFNHTFLSANRIDDLDVKYRLELFDHKVLEEKIGFSLREEEDTIFAFKGECIIFDFEKVNFGNQPFLYLNRNFAKESRSAVFPYRDSIVVKEKDHEYDKDYTTNFFMYDSLLTNKILLDRVAQIINSENELFDSKGKVFVIFAGRRMVFYSDYIREEMIKLPFIISPKKAKSLELFQQGQVYYFTNLISKINNLYNKDFKV